MNDRLALRRLWWKELRQLAPLVILLPLLVVLLLALHRLAYSPNRMLGSATSFLCFGMPGIFACGVGALLVGYEKELRTINWLVTLPIARQRIVRVKVGAAVAGLLVLWGLAVAIFSVASQASPYVSTHEVTDPWPWILHSLFVLLAGFALAWAVRSALVSLLLVVPVAMLPHGLAYVIDHWTGQFPGNSDPTTGTLLTCQLVGIVLATWLNERYGKLALQPQTTDRPLAGWLSTVRHARTDATQFKTAKVQSPVPALLWQFTHQNQAVLLGTSIMLAVAIALLTMTDNRSASRLPLSIALLLAFLATAWLGVISFQSDAFHRRIRFLSDRGISPRLIWLTRHAVPLSVLSMCALLVVVILLFTTDIKSHQLEEISLAIGIYWLGAVVVYLVSQWFGQVMFSPIVSAIAAPFVAWGAIGYGVFAFEVLGAPYWIALLLLPLPAIATWGMTRRWMDRRLGLSYWASHAGFLAAVGILPFVPVLVAVALQPKMRSEIALEMQQVLQKPMQLPSGTIELVMPKQEAEDQATGTIEQRVDQSLDYIESQLRATDKPIGMSSWNILAFLRATATLSRMSLDATTAEQGDAASEDEQALQHYRRAFDLLVQITQRMRHTYSLREQDMADLIEIWLLSEMLRDETRERLGDPLYETTADMLKDHSLRREARMRAVAMSWKWFQEATVTPEYFGGYELYGLQENLGTLKGSWVAKRRVGVAVADLWILARDGADAATSERRSRVADFWGHSLARYGLGTQGRYYRADDLEYFLHPSLDRLQIAVASQWDAGWERLAAEHFSEK